ATRRPSRDFSVRAQADRRVQRQRAVVEEIQRPDVDGAAREVDPRRRGGDDPIQHREIICWTGCPRFITKNEGYEGREGNQVRTNPPSCSSIASLLREDPSEKYYSSRSTRIGSVVAARRAGRNDARPAIAASTIGTTANVIGSRAGMPKTSEASSVDEA